jgi:hypothetical protein
VDETREQHTVTAPTIEEASRPIHLAAFRTGSDEQPSVWRSAVVALGLMGVAPTDTDVRAAAAGESHDQAAVALGDVLADPEGAGAIIEVFERLAFWAALERWRWRGNDRTLLLSVAAQRGPAATERAVQSSGRRGQSPAAF